jgi:hydroxymethylglutaryl-CoA lyase
MSELPKQVLITEEGPREGFQFEKGPIPTERKIELIDALSQTGLKQIQIVSFVSPKLVPGMADAEQVVAGFKKHPGVAYVGLSLNDKGVERALSTGRLDVKGNITLTASEAFLKRNQNRTFEENIRAQHDVIKMFRAHNVPIERGGVMAAFGCNFEGDIPVERVLSIVQQIKSIAAEYDIKLKTLTLADTMAWATPASIKRVVGAVQDKNPELEIILHLHDTRGLGIANAYAGLEMGVRRYDAAVAGLGGCPFAGHKGAAGNVCTEDLVFMCEEMGIETGVDLEKLIDAARLAQDIVGHALPGSVMLGGSLRQLRSKPHAAA